MQGLQLTYTQLAGSSNRAAVDVLVSMIDHPNPATRLMTIQALLRRSEPECGEAVLSRWESLDLECRRHLRNKKDWIAPAIENSLQQRDANLGRAIAATETLGVQAAVCHLIPIAEIHPSEVVRESATKTILELVHQLGRDARAERGQPSVRMPILARLAESVKRFSIHRNEDLVDAFLMVCTWGDAELRDLIAPDSQCRNRIAERLHRTSRVGIVELLTGFLHRRSVPPFILKILADRRDEVYRDFYLRTIGHEPSPIVQRNLAEVGIPTCCFGDAKLMDQISPDHRAAAVFVYNQAHADLMGYLRTVVAALKRGGPGVVTASVIGLGKCEVPNVKVWLRSAVVLASGDSAAIQADPNAQLLENMIQLLDHPDAALVRMVRRTLEPLHVDSMLDRLQALPAEHRRAIGRIVLTIDSDAIARIRDGLRHPVLKKRLSAIAAADALAAVDLLGDAFERISREDHQEARMLACEVMAHAESTRSLTLLKEMAALPPCPVRDAAIKALEHRGASLV
ncbi:hypothetical protein Poly41_11330 [Novipirellula artificiosorum]|uniref:HEAT repeat protein n=2 Tax=Novipirellula artificiosorum TaxID=2528016 RepID=A0A5C6E1P0_9BACT|nr:hypothetical protein Poly41_11330 [Novipirellula artificiosorum]